MKFNLSLLLLLSSLSAFAQTPQETGRGNIYDSSRGGLLPGFRGRQDVDFSRQATEGLRRLNDRAAGSDDSYPRPCTPIQPGSSNVVANPCPAGTDEWGRPTVPTCNVNYTGISEVAYNPQLNLNGLIIKGNHSAPSGTTTTNFEVLDTDGFLTIAALHSSWQARRLLQGISTPSHPVPFIDLPITDINMLRAAAQMGKHYHETVKAKIDAERPANYADANRLLVRKIAFDTALLRKLDEWVLLRGRVPLSQIRETISSSLEDLAPGAEQTMMAQYLDRDAGDRPQVLCNPGNASQMVGQVVCAFNYETSARRDPNFCPGGIRFDDLGTTSVCQRVAGVDRTCRATITSPLPNGAPTPSFPAAVPAAGSR